MNFWLIMVDEHTHTSVVTNTLYEREREREKKRKRELVDKSPSQQISNHLITAALLNTNRQPRITEHLREVPSMTKTQTNRKSNMEKIEDIKPRKSLRK